MQLFIRVDAYNASTLSLPDVYMWRTVFHLLQLLRYGSFFARVYVHGQNLSIITHSLASSDPLSRRPTVWHEIFAGSNFYGFSSDPQK